MCPKLTTLPLSTAGVSLCPALLVNRSAPSESSLDDGLSKKFVIPNRKGLNRGACSTEAG